MINARDNEEGGTWAPGAAKAYYAEERKRVAQAKRNYDAGMKLLLTDTALTEEQYRMLWNRDLPNNTVRADGGPLKANKRMYMMLVQDATPEVIKHINRKWYNMAKNYKNW